MQAYIFRRILFFVPTLFLITIVSFIVIVAPPGDYADTIVTAMLAEGMDIEQGLAQALRVRYGLDKPVVQQYFIWIRNIFQGDLGVSLVYSQPVSKLIMQRLPWSVLVSFTSLVVVYVIGFPIGVFAAIRQYSVADYVFSFVGFLGLATPNFLLALIFLFFYFRTTGQVLVGLFSEQYILAPWSFGKVLDLLNHLWIPAIITGTAGTAGLIRIVRANLLDELKKLYVTTARAKGVSEPKLIFKYPVRMAVNPIISGIGGILPALIGGEVITSLVIGLPTVGPLLLEALQAEDMFMAGSIILILSVLTVIGTLISDLMLVVIDPRIRYG